jgi:hypothetical protein
MLITIKNMKGEVQELEDPPAASVAQIGTMIAEQNQIPADTLKLIFRKKQLKKTKLFLTIGCRPVMLSFL